VTTNNDTPQIFGPGAHDDDAPAEWHDGPADPDGSRPDPRDQPAPGNHYPVDASYPRQVGYPQDPGYPDHPEELDDTGYANGADYPDGPVYPAAPEYLAAADLDYPPDAGYPPPMEPLAGLEFGEAAGRDPRPAAASDPDHVHETSDSLTTESLLHGKRAAPGSGWRRSVYRATGGLLRFGESAAEMRRRDLINRVRTPVAGGHHRVAVLSLKGGVGKTTTAVGLGATLATLRGDRVIAVDANPDRGTLSDKVRLETAATIRDLLNERDQVLRYADVRAFTSQAPSRLEVLASDRDPAVSVAFGADDYCDAARVLEHFYSICITDCGTGLLHSAMSGVLRLADQIVLVSSPSVDGARSASATLDWLEAHRYGDLVRNGVVVLSAIRPRSKSTVDLDRLEHHFAARCRAVARIPYDPHLEEGAEVELELLGSETAEAYLTLAATVGDGFAWPRRLTSRSALP
jgi:MinD-like ATPase involved in chromosome partitioning or flagellar assembly